MKSYCNALNAADSVNEQFLHLQKLKRKNIPQ